MRAQITVEQYFLYEAIATINAVIDALIEGENFYENRSLAQQWERLKQAFHYFMIDLDVDDFTDIKQREERPSSYPSSDRKPNRKKPSKLKKMKDKIIKSVKRGLLNTIVTIEDFLKPPIPANGDKHDEFENRIRSSSYTE